MTRQHHRSIAVAAIIMAVTLPGMAETAPAQQPSPRTAADMPQEEPSISVQGTQVHVAAAAGQMLEVYDLAGVRVAAIRIDSEDSTIALRLTRGCYILRVGKVVRKISIK